MSPALSYPYAYLANESYSLLSRLCQLKPFSMTMPMVKGASVSNEALRNIMELLESGKAKLYKAITLFIGKIKKAKYKRQHPAELQAEFALLKLRYNSILDQLDIFADVLSQRSEHEVGIWLCGLDVLAEDGLTFVKDYFDPPALMVFLDRGHGAAIRRAKTRLPGGDLNPVAVIQIPRERLVGSGIASSLIHEVGHQAIEMLGVLKSLKIAIASEQQAVGTGHDAWGYYERWISEIMADYWALGHLGIAATLGLMGVVTLPGYFQFRLDLQDPHPAPYVRVKLSCEFGKALFPDAQWDKVWTMWKLFYCTDRLSPEKQNLLYLLDEKMPCFIELVNNHRPCSLKGKRLADIFPVEERQSCSLREYYQQWKTVPRLIEKASPTLVFAVMGQAKSDLLLRSGEESRILTRQLRNWAFKRN